MIQIENLTKQYGKKKAVDNISFTIESGEVVGFLGPNGAGKSTTMNMITGYISSTSGKAMVDGFDILDNPIEAKKKIGYLPEIPPLYMDMTVLEYLDFVYELKGVKEARNAHLKRIMELVKILDVRNRRIGNLSKGYKQRVGLAQALIGDPEVLILDEPTVGLDPRQIIEMREVIKGLGKERTVILSTHIMQEVSAICDKVIIINKGKIIATDTPENLAKKIENSSRMMARISGDIELISETIRQIEGVASVKVRDRDIEDARDFLIETESGKDVRADLFNKMSEINCPIIMLKNVEASLEEIFLKMTSSGDTVSANSKKKEARKDESDL